MFVVIRDSCREEKAVFRCSTCHMYLCNRAAEMHRDLAATFDHELHVFDVASCNSDELRQALLEIRSFRCAAHADQSVECFCETCDVPVCAKCVLRGHMGHQHKTLELVEGSLKGAVSELIAGSSEWLNAVESGIEKVNKRKEEIDEQAEGLGNIAREAFKSVHKALE